MIKKLFRKFIVKWLALNARILLARKKPEVIGITGAVGKTSTKEFLTKILNTEFEILSPKEGFNTEMGASLALFGESVPKKINSPFGWISIALVSFIKALTIRDFPRKVVVEMGADKPGDIKFLVSIFKPKIGIILTVLPVHLEEFKTVIGVAEEKSELAKVLPEDGMLFLNYDDKTVREMAPKTKAKVIFFGTKNKEGFIAKNIKNNLSGMSFRLITPEEREMVMKVRLYGLQMIYPIMASIAVASAEGVSIKKVSTALKEISPFKGRMNVIEGIRNSIIIDDSYNASPEAVKRALEFLRVQSGRRIALLGNMNELGDFEKEGHEQVGKSAADSVDYLFTVGEAAKKYLLPAAVKSGLKKEKTLAFENAVEAGDHLKKIIKEGDVILVKGSQNKVRLERAIEKFMTHPEKKRKLLVRQSQFWQERA